VPRALASHRHSRAARPSFCVGRRAAPRESARPNSFLRRLHRAQSRARMRRRWGPLGRVALSMPDSVANPAAIPANFAIRGAFSTLFPAGEPPFGLEFIGTTFESLCVATISTPANASEEAVLIPSDHVTLVPLRDALTEGPHAGTVPDPRIFVPGHGAAGERVRRVRARRESIHMSWRCRANSDSLRTAIRAGMRCLPTETCSLARSGPRLTHGRGGATNLAHRHLTNP